MRQCLNKYFTSGHAFVSTLFIHVTSLYTLACNKDSVLKWSSDYHSQVVALLLAVRQAKVCNRRWLYSLLAKLVLYEQNKCRKKQLLAMEDLHFANHWLVRKIFACNAKFESSFKIAQQKSYFCHLDNILLSRGSLLTIKHELVNFALNYRI